MKVRDVIEMILTETCGEERLKQTCDQLICGKYDTQVTGIVSTFMATIDVIKEAIAIGANMIITHEPTFYTANDELDWLENDPLFLEKKRLIEDNQLAIWRYHDYMHRAKPDKIYEGLIKELGWENYFVDEKQPFIYKIDETSLADLALFLKDKLAMKVIRIVGNPEMACSKVGILVGGASLGLGREEMPMELMSKHELDVMVCGEITEWTLSAYINDAAMLGMKKGMIILGHERSEEWGMKYLVEWLKPLFKNIPITFVDAKEPFIYL